MLSEVSKNSIALALVSSACANSRPMLLYLRTMFTQRRTHSNNTRQIKAREAVECTTQGLRGRVRERDGSTSWHLCQRSFLAR